MSKTKPKCKLIGCDSNAFVILGKVVDALRTSGYSKEEITEFQEKATGGDYNNLLRVCMEYVEII